MDTERGNELKRSQTTATSTERKKLAASLASCIVKLLLFWKLCKKKKKVHA